MAETDELPQLEHGRYRLNLLPDQGILISRRTDLCDRCKDCGCGTIAEPVPIPGVVAKVLTGQEINVAEIAGLLSQMPPGALVPQFLKGMFRRGRNGSKPANGYEAAESSDPAGSDLDYVPAARSSDQEGSSSSGDGGSGDPDQV